MKKMKRTVAAAAGLSLALGLAACSEAKDAAKDAGNAASEAADKGMEKASDAADKGKEKASEGMEKASDAMSKDVEMVQVAAADGSNVEVPAQLRDAATQAEGEHGKIKSAEKGSKDNQYLATLEDGTLLVFNGEDVAPVIGKIAETWTSEGGLDSSVGAPLSAEKVIDGGWSQDFQNGTITWTADANGQYGANISTK